ncbi:hypothetical protein [Zeaxanthinibacter enoshimensis]|uniref:Ankyrin repeat protein n=1 Tax=Zeaxanthinibacter enoshimensis TaxID=392009 RepID=A0A4R6TPY8_9FLAO|nr:hypothetical protein [Zeaxanthinibacter enoshimensis]TDQ33385.1 hypothetical protein CLV82_1224 [Zeaxanthinibacter enoshimensis]
MDYNIKIIELLETEDEEAIFNQVKEWDILFDFTDDYGNNLIHLAVRRNLLSLVEKLLKADELNSNKIDGFKWDRIINDLNEKEKTPLDYSVRKEMEDLIQSYGGKTGSEVQAYENDYYSGDIWKMQTGCFVNDHMFNAIMCNNFIEFKELYELDVAKGGLLLPRLYSKNKNGQNFLELAEQLDRTEIIEYLKTKTRG